MRPYFLILCSWLCFGCTHHAERPDTSGIHITVNTMRYERDLFSIDTNHFAEGMDRLARAYPGFHEDFLYRIMNADPKWDENQLANYMSGFVKSYRAIYDSAERVFPDFSSYEREIVDVMKLSKYYFPAYKIPEKIITYIGPLDGYGDILSDQAVLVGLHHHLGKQFSAYSSEWLGQTYPAYITERFEPEYIAVNFAGNIINDLFPEGNNNNPDESIAGTTLIVKMIESGKRIYLKSRLLPDKKEYLLIGYSESQLSDCYKHEKSIWDLFLKNNLLQTTDIGLIRNYIGESPKTQELGESAPGNIGSFAGWQIVKKFMEKNPEISLEQLMKKKAEEIFESTKYKP